MLWYVHVICVGGLSQEVQCESSVLPLPQQEKQPQQESGCTSEGIPEQNASTRVPQQESGCSSRAVAEQHTPFGMYITVATNCDLSTLLCDLSPLSFICMILMSNQTTLHFTEAQQATSEA